MPKSRAVESHWSRVATMALLLALVNCAQLPPTSSAVIPPIPSGAARLWFYRDYEPHETLAART